MIFSEQLILTIVDKLLIGLIIVALGFVANFVLERFKSDLAIRSELATKRVLHVEEVWSAFYTWESTVNELVLGINRIIEKHGEAVDARNQALIKEIKPLEARSEKQMNDAIRLAEEKRFWLGEKNYERLMSFQSSLTNYMLAYVNIYIDGDLEQIKIAERQRDDTRMSLADFIENIE